MAMSERKKLEKQARREKERQSVLERRRQAFKTEARSLEALREAHRLAQQTKAARKAAQRLQVRLNAITARKPHPIYDSPRWRSLRLDVLARAGGRCCLCGRGARDGAVLHVDHIKPVSRYPALTWEPSNLQVLCADCNLGKSNRYTTDWR